MVRNYKPKRFNQYEVERLQEAVQKFFERQMTVEEASRTYKVPRTTLSNHVNGRSSGKFSYLKNLFFDYERTKLLFIGIRPGRQPVFSNEQEK